jgi:hypothetical protein
MGDRPLAFGVRPVDVAAAVARSPPSGRLVAAGGMFARSFPKALA